MSAKKRSLSRVDLVNASVKCKLVVNVHATAFVVCANHALAYAVVNFPSGRDKNVTVDASEVRVGLCVSNGNFELGSHGVSPLKLVALRQYRLSHPSPSRESVRGQCLFSLA
jgi:hypothetical protein